MWEPKYKLDFGLKRMMEEHRYGYIDPDLIDIVELNFVSNEIADAIPHPAQARKDSKKELLRQLLTRDFLKEMDTILGRKVSQRDSDTRPTFGLVGDENCRTISRRYQDKICFNNMSNSPTKKCMSIRRRLALRTTTMNGRRVL